MEGHVGDEFDGLITGVTSFGVFVVLNGMYAEGLVHVTSLPRDYYKFDSVGHCLTGERSGRVYRLGDPLRVRVTRVDIEDRKIDFDPVVGPDGSEGGDSGASSKRRGRSGRKKSASKKQAANKESTSKKTASKESVSNEPASKKTASKKTASKKKSGSGRSRSRRKRRSSANTSES
jgi:ribonuclease R